LWEACSPRLFLLQKVKTFNLQRCRSEIFPYPSSFLSFLRMCFFEVDPPVVFFFYSSPLPSRPRGTLNTPTTVPSSLWNFAQRPSFILVLLTPLVANSDLFHWLLSLFSRRFPCLSKSTRFAECASSAIKEHRLGGPVFISVKSSVLDRPSSTSFISDRPHLLCTDDSRHTLSRTLP